MPAKILIADDSATDRLIIKNMLSEYNTLTACDGQEAMLLIDLHPDIDILILDLNMPKMDGFEILEVLKSNDSSRMYPTKSNSAPLCRGDGRTGRNPKGFDETWNLHCRGLRFQHVLA
jgi:CheY-like chemotaxis protein